MNGFRIFNVKIEVDGEVIVETEILAKDSEDLRHRLGVLLLEIDPKAKLAESRDMGAYYE